MHKLPRSSVTTAGVYAICICIRTSICMSIESKPGRFLSSPIQSITRSKPQVHPIPSPPQQSTLESQSMCTPQVGDTAPGKLRITRLIIGLIVLAEDQNPILELVEVRSRSCSRIASQCRKQSNESGKCEWLVHANRSVELLHSRTW